MYLTGWWMAFAEDLDNLAPKVKDSHSVPWVAARAMIAAGIQIEDNLFLKGIPLARKIKEETEKLGPSFYNEVSKKQMPLPAVSSPDTLLFAMVFLKHLERTQLVTEGNTLITSKIDEERLVILRSVEELNNRINTYLSDPQNVNEIKQVCAEAVVDPTKELKEQLQLWIAAEPMARKFVKQIEDAIVLIIDMHDLKQESIHSLFTKVELLLIGKASVLRHIAAHMQLIEWLDEGKLTPDDLTDTSNLIQNYPDFADSWLKLHEVPPRAQKKNSVAGILSSLTQLIATNSPKSQRKQSLVQRAQDHIAKLIPKLNITEGATIGVNDFKKMTAKEVLQLADKTELVHSILILKKCLMLYQKEYTNVLTKISLMVFFKPITEFMSQTFLSYLMPDTVLLMLEARKLAKQMEALAQSIQEKSESEFDKNTLVNEVRTTLLRAQEKTQTVSRNRMVFFFKDEPAGALKNLKAIVDEAAQAPMFT